MNVQIRNQVITLVAGLVALGVLLAGFALARDQAAANTQGAWEAAPQASSSAAIGVASTKTLTRNLEPVIVAGSTISRLSGVPTDTLWVYAYSGGAWTQIPAQVDEVSSSGDYVSAEDGILDANDELVFMVKDLGDQAPAEPSIRSVLSAERGWYEVEVTNPITPTEKGWAYVVHSSKLTQTFVDDYVDFDTDSHRIVGTTYSLGAGSDHPLLEYMSFAGSDTDLLDRTKSRLYCAWPPPTCPKTEDDILPLPDGLVRDGPVRVIVREGKGLAYHSMVHWNTQFRKILGLGGDVRFSTDFSSTVKGATLYNAAVPGGVTVDGTADTVPSTPASPWWQLSTVTGTVVQVEDASAAGGTQSNYYEDDATLDSNDTGDGMRYGDIGTYIANPTFPFTYTFAFYSLPPSRPNVGATYLAYFQQPLSVTASTTDRFVFLPLVLRNQGP